jgi:hypothetical protein
MIVLVKDYFDMEIIGKTIDDAAGVLINWKNLRSRLSSRPIVD